MQNTAAENVQRAHPRVLLAIDDPVALAIESTGLSAPGTA